MKKSGKLGIKIAAIGCVLLLTNEPVLAAAISENVVEEEAPAENDFMPNGILIVENASKCGELNLFYKDQQLPIKCDYAEYEIPLYTICEMEITPFDGYEVEQMMMNGEPLEQTESGYRFPVNQDMVQISVKYRKVEAFYENMEVENEKHNVSEITENLPSVSAESFDVTVTYLDEEDQIVPVEEIEKQEEIGTIENTEESQDVNLQNENLSKTEVTILDGNLQVENPAISTEEETRIGENDAKENVMSAAAENTSKVKRRVRNSVGTNSSSEEAVAETKDSSAITKKSVQNTEKIKQKSVSFLPIYPLYLLGVCCIIIRKANSIKKKG